MTLETLDLIASLAAWFLFWGAIFGLVNLRGMEAENGKPITNFLVNRRMYILGEYAVVFVLFIATPVQSMPATAFALMITALLYWILCGCIAWAIINPNL